MRCRFGFCGFIVAFAVFSVIYAQGDDSKSSDLDRLQGSWQIVLQERDGELRDLGVGYITFKGKTVRTMINGKSVESGDMLLEPGESLNKYDFKITGDSAEIGKTYQGIYRLKGDTFQTCVRIKEDAKRPTKFATEPGSGHQLVVFRKLGSVLAKEP